MSARATRPTALNHLMLGPEETRVLYWRGHSPGTIMSNGSVDTSEDAKFAKTRV